MTLTESADNYLKKTRALAENQTSHKLAGLLIQHYRQKLGLRASKLADQLDISPSVISKIEAGKQGVGGRAGALQLETLWDALKIDDPLVKAKLVILYGQKDASEMQFWDNINVKSIDIVNSILQDIEQKSLRYSESEEFLELLAPVMTSGDFLFHRARLAYSYEKYQEAANLYKQALAYDAPHNMPPEQNYLNYAASLFRVGNQLLNAINKKEVESYLQVDSSISQQIEIDYKVIIRDYFDPALKNSEKASHINPFYRNAISQKALIHYALCFSDQKNIDYHSSQAIKYFKNLFKTYELPEYFEVSNHHRNFFSLIPLLWARMYALQANYDMAYAHTSSYAASIAPGSLNESSSIENIQKSANYYYTLGVIKGREKLHSEAHELFKKAIELDSHMEVVLFEDVHILETIRFIKQSNEERGTTENV